MEIQSRLLIALVLLTSYTIQGYVFSEDDSTQDDLKSLLKDIEENENGEMLIEELDLRSEIGAKPDEKNSPSNSNQFNVNLQRRLWEQSKAYRQVTKWFQKRHVDQNHPSPICKQSHISQKICKFIINSKQIHHVCRTVYPVTCV